MNAEIFWIYVETQLAPTLAPRDIVLLDNVAFHKGPQIEEIVKARGAWLLFLPAYSPDLIRSKWRFPNSKPCSAKPLQGLSPICGRLSPTA